MDEVKGFKDRLDHLMIEAREGGNKISVQRIRTALGDAGLSEDKLQMVYTYLDSMAIQVYDEDLPEAASDIGLAGGGSLDRYLEELDRVTGMDQVEELTLFHMAAVGDQSARDRLTSQYLQTVVDLAGEIEGREKQAGEKGLSLDGDFTAEDLIQEGNMGLVQALASLEKQENLSAYRAVLLNRVTKHMEDAVEDRKSLARSDDRILNRMNQLAAASHDLERDLDRKPSLEELSAYLDLPESELKDLLRVGGEKLKADDL